jgi:hypothetical protein
MSPKKSDKKRYAQPLDGARVDGKPPPDPAKWMEDWARRRKVKPV